MHTTSKRPFHRLVLLLAFALMLTACTAGVSKTGQSEHSGPRILIGESTRSDVEGLFGPPTEVLEREEEVWVYRGLSPELLLETMPFYCGDKPLVFYFSLDGTVSRISRRAPAL